MVTPASGPWVPVRPSSLRVHGCRGPGTAGGPAAPGAKRHGLGASGPWPAAGFTESRFRRPSASPAVVGPARGPGGRGGGGARWPNGGAVLRHGLARRSLSRSPGLGHSGWPTASLRTRQTRPPGRLSIMMPAQGGRHSTGTSGCLYWQSRSVGKMIPGARTGLVNGCKLLVARLSVLCAGRGGVAHLRLSLQF